VVHMGGWLARLLSARVLVVALASVAFADQGSDGRGRGHGRGHNDGGPTTTSSGDLSPAQAPEIDVSGGINALALLAGGLIVLRGRRQANRS